jgi:hypothetical protein
MNESVFERLRFWLCNNILHHKFSHSWIYLGKCHNSCKICKRTISFPVNKRFEGYCGRFSDWRCRFAFFPVDRWVMDEKGFVEKSGTYHLQFVYEVKAGLVPSWVAYAKHNDIEES